jgi:hypothetical protein
VNARSILAGKRALGSQRLPVLEQIRQLDGNDDPCR